jgi:hypothetical protein
LYLIVFAFLALFGALLHLIVSKRGRTPTRIIEIALLYWFVIAIGASGIFAFAGHTFRANRVAASIGWPAGNPFQQEVAFADLALGILGVACIAIRQNFWTATAVATAVMYWGDALDHAYQLLRYGNNHPGNSGAVLWGTTAIPTVTIALLLWRASVLRRDVNRNRPRPRPPRTYGS